MSTNLNTVSDFFSSFLTGYLSAGDINVSVILSPIHVTLVIFVRVGGGGQALKPRDNKFPSSLPFRRVY